MLNQIQTLSSEVGHNNENENEIEEEEVEKLEAEVKGMGEKIVEYRNSVPDQLKNALASTLVAQRPLLPTHLHHESLPQQSSAQEQALPCSTLPTNLGVDVGTPSAVSPAEPLKRRSGRLQALASSPTSSNPLTTTSTQKRGRGRGNKRKQQLASLEYTVIYKILDILASILKQGEKNPKMQNNDVFYAGEPIESDKGHQLSEEQDRETAEKTQLLKQKISSNVSALPLLLKRMKECISKIDNLQSSNEFIIHPAFKRKRTS
ncbi:unnamed protein product [Camellia sinensis]